MKEIDRFKFRGVSEDTGRMEFGIGFSYCDSRVYITERNQRKAEKENVWNHTIKKGTLNQSTGFKDKNGKLIFEGDVVKISTDKTEKIVIVEYDKKYKHFVYSAGKEKFEMYFPWLTVEIVGYAHKDKE